MMNLYPLLMAPYFRHGSETPWGGYMLRYSFGKDTPNDLTGESLEISTAPGQESVIRNGIHAGKTLARVAQVMGYALTGTEDGRFPLLLKLLDAQQMLSVQVHPDDEYAAEQEGTPGKNKVWVVLTADSDAKIVYGLDTNGEDLRTIVSENRLGSVVHYEHVRPGDVFYIPAGTAHALGDGVQIYDIQQAGGPTYRLWDWERNDFHRELHIEKALDVCVPDRKMQKIGGTTVLCKGGSRTYYVSDEHIELCRLNLYGTMPLESGRMLFLTPMSECTLAWGSEEMTLAPFDSVVIPAALEDVRLIGDTKVLMSSLPKREELREELGYRAENVAGLV